MTAFLLTWKETGWRHENIARMAAEHGRQGFVNEPWRLIAHKQAKEGDRVWVLRQGRGRKGIFFGEITGPPFIGRTTGAKAQWMVPVRFESFVDPDRKLLIDEPVVLGILRPNQIAAPASGYPIDDSQSNAFEMVLRSGPVSVADRNDAPTGRDSQENSTSNPDWTRDELILALDMYLRHRPSPPAKGSSEILQLSETLQRLGEKLFPPDQRAQTFRNPNGVYMKLMNLRRLDPSYTSEGRTGLTRGNKGEEDVWNEFAGDPGRCARIAAAIVAGLDDPDAGSGTLPEQFDDGIEEAAEGRILTRVHVGRERDRRLVASKVKRVMRERGRLECEVCGFDFALRYGDRGNCFIECHHVKPVADLEDGQMTHLKDLALVCANCHRMIYRRRPWLSVDELKRILKGRN